MFDTTAIHYQCPLTSFPQNSPQLTPLFCLSLLLKENHVSLAISQSCKFIRFLYLQVIKHIKKEVAFFDALNKHVSRDMNRGKGPNYTHVKQVRTREGIAQIIGAGGRGIAVVGVTFVR